MADELRYVPESDLSAICSSLNVRRVLTLEEPAVEPYGVQIRTASVPKMPLPAGAYLHALASGGWAALLVAGNDFVEPQEDRWSRVEDSHLLAQGRQWFESLWPGAKRYGQQATYASGTLVRLAGKDELAIVDSAEWTETGFVYTVRTDESVRKVAEAGLLPGPSGGSDPEPQQWLGLKPGQGRAGSRFLTHTKFTAGLTDTYFSIGSTRTRFWAYQFKPVLAFLKSPGSRLLIADEVGLGKTIEAGLIWTELEARGQINRALVVCPSMLVTKWRDEMRSRFDRSIRILDKFGFDDLVELFAKGDLSTPLLGVISLEKLRTAQAAERLAETNPAFDLVIVDEAHYLRNTDTRSYDVGELLSEWSDALLFLSATPLNLGTGDLFNLLHLLQPAQFPDQLVFEDQLAPNAALNQLAAAVRRSHGSPRELRGLLEAVPEEGFGRLVRQRPEFADLEQLLSHAHPLSPEQVAHARRLLASLHTLSGVITRTRKVDVDIPKATRVPSPINVEWSDQELRIYQAVWHWTRLKAKADGTPPGFTQQMPLRQTASCIPAMQRRFTEQARTGESSADDFDDDERFDGDHTWDPEAADATELAKIIGGKIPRDRKFEAFVETMREHRRNGLNQALVFSFFRGTLAHLRERLQGEFRVAVMDGSVKVPERERLMRSFRVGEIDLLLLSEVGAEGLDFEFCNIVVHYDLPWNPMRVEQRIGRVDRFGQKHDKIFVHYFHCPGTIETDILERLYLRIRVFEESIGELEPILRSEIDEVQRIALDPQLSDAQREQRVRQHEIALAEKAKNVAELGEATGQLAGIDGLLIDGFEEDRGRGRYIGSAELAGLTEIALRGTGARLELVDDGLSGVLYGDERLAKDIAGIRGASRYSESELQSVLSSGDPVVVSFDSDHSLDTATDLVGARHPLIQLAVRKFERLPSAQTGRWTMARIDGEPDGQYLVMLHVRETTGIRPVTEVWPVALDIATGKVTEGAGWAYTRAVAVGAVRDRTSRPIENPATALREIEAEVSRQLDVLNREAQQVNDSLVDSRIEAVRQELTYKIKRAERQAQEATDGRIERLHVGRARNLRAELERRVEEFEGRRAVSVSVTPLQVVDLVVGR